MCAGAKKAKALQKGKKKKNGGEEEEVAELGICTTPDSSQRCLFSTAVLGKKKKNASCQGNAFSGQGGEEKNKTKHIIQEIQKLCLIAYCVFRPRSFLKSTADLVMNSTAADEWAGARVTIYITIIKHHVTHRITY